MSTTKMQCDEFERILEQQDDASLPQPALAHMEDCEACRFLTADLSAIRDAALELSTEELPVPERVWISLRNQIDAESLSSPQRQPVSNLKPGWWAAFQRPTLAGAFLSYSCRGRPGWVSIGLRATGGAFAAVAAAGKRSGSLRAKRIQGRVRGFWKFTATRIEAAGCRGNGFASAQPERG